MASRRRSAASENPQAHGLLQRLSAAGGQFLFSRGVPSPSLSAAEGQSFASRGVPSRSLSAAVGQSFTSRAVLSPSLSAAGGQFASPLRADGSSASRAPAAELKRPKGFRSGRPFFPRGVPSGGSLFARVSALVAGATISVTACGPAAAPAANRPVAPTAAADATASAQSPLSDDAASATELTVWYFDKVSMETVIPLFEQSHPGVKVNFVEQPFGDMSKK